MSISLADQMMEYNYVFQLAVGNNSESMLNQGDADGRTYMNHLGDEYPISEISIYILLRSAQFYRIYPNEKFFCSLFIKRFSHSKCKNIIT